MDYLTQIIFDVTDFEFDPEVITKNTGIVPKYTRIKGQARMASGAPDTYNIFKRTVWSLYSRSENKDDSVSCHWDSIKDDLTRNVDFFKSLQYQSKMLITICVYPKEFYPSVYIPNSLCKFAVDIGSDIDVDALGTI